MVHQKTSTSAGLALASAFFMLTACQPHTATPPAEAPAAAPAESAAVAPASTDGCAATVERRWGRIGPSDGPSYRVKAWTSGAICESAVVTLAIYARDGFPIYAWAGATQYLFSLKDAKSLAEMNTALDEWIGPDTLPADMTGTLPPWEETESQARQAEFPFMPNIEKNGYEDLRKQNLHMLCYPQGIESSLCLALHQDGGAPMIEEIGIQRFPG